MAEGWRLLAANLLFTFFVPGTVAGFLPWYLSRREAGFEGGLAHLAWPLLAFGLAVYAFCVWDFATFGRGTPAPIAAPKRLVVRCLYRRTRNPMYVGVGSVIAAWAVAYRSWRIALYLASVLFLFHLFVVLYEERRLRREFGEEYRRYCQEVPRWLF